MTSTTLNLVVAACNNRGIGVEGRLPWRLRKDMDFFKKITTETKNPEKKNAVIMGRKTWFSIPEKFRPLKERINIVLSRELKEIENGVYVSRGLRDALDLVNDEDLRSKIENVYVIGGSSVYKEAMTGPYKCRLYLTNIMADFECDTFLPGIDEKVFQKVENPVNVPSGIHSENGIYFQFEVYDKVQT
jgi:dihydrofolate reductase